MEEHGLDAILNRSKAGRKNIQFSCGMDDVVEGFFASFDLRWSFCFQSRYRSANYFFLPVSFFLLDWAGKTVARKKYNVVATSIKMYTIPVPLTTAFVSLSNIGAGIWWRMILFNILLFPLSFASSFLFSALPVAGIVSFLLFIFLQILILGWVTNRVISRLFKLSFVTTKIDRKVERKKTVRHNNLPMYSLMSIKCPFCKRKLKYSSDPTKLYICRCGAYGEWEIEGKVLQFSKGNQSKTVNYNIMTVKSFWSIRKEHKGRSQNKR